MGMFSWKTQDTNKSIAAKGSNRPTFPVTMTDANGRKWTETDYRGYGVFGRKDYYELLAEMNGLDGRSAGINLVFSGEPYLSPNLSQDENWEWRDERPEECEYQGFFYPEESEQSEK